MGLINFASTLDFTRTSRVMQPVVNEAFNARIQIIDPNIDSGTYNRMTNTAPGAAPTVLWEGPARIQALRWPNVAAPRGESVSLRTVTFHIPLDEEFTLFVREGWRIRVLDGGMDHTWEKGMYTITTSVNTSYAWDRRIETMMDQGVDVSN